MTKTSDLNIQSNDSPTASKEQPANEELPKFVIPLIIGCITAFFFLWLLYASHFGWRLSESREHWGQFGDYVGGILNPIVAIGALAGIWYAVLLQKRELRETKDALHDQAKTANQQRREQRFFDALKLYQETLRSVEFERYLNNGTLSYSGKSAFQFIATREVLTKAGGDTTNRLPGMLNKTTAITEAQKLEFSEALEDWSSLLDHYFRVIFLILNEAELTLGADHFRYTKYLRAQLSKDEVQLITLNILFDAEGKKMASLAEKYGLLKHLPAGRLRNYAQTKLPANVFGKGWVKPNPDVAGNHVD